MRSLEKKLIVFAFGLIIGFLCLLSFFVLTSEAQPMGEIDPRAIHKDGSSTTTAVIPFAEGISVVGSSDSDGIKVAVPAPSIFDLFFGGLRFYRAEESTPAAYFSFTRAGPLFGDYESLDITITAKANQTGVGGGIFAADSLTSGYSGGPITLQGGLGLGDGSGGNIIIHAGDHNTSGTGLGGDIILSPGQDYSGGGNHGSVKVYNPQLSSYWTLVDPDGNAFTQQLTTSGTTTIQSLTGIIKGSTGVLSAASSSDLLTAIGTIDISSNTNLAVSSPITLTGDTVGFDFSTNNTWTGTQRFNGNVGINTASDSPGRLKVAGAGYFQNETNAFGTSNPYTALVLDGGADGALYAIGRADSKDEPFVGLSGWDGESERSLFYGGGGWSAPDATHHYFYASQTYTEKNDTGVLIAQIDYNGLAISSGKKFYIEGPGSDTYFYYDSGSSSVKFYVNGALAMELK